MTITETPRRLEPVTADPFIAGLERAGAKPAPRHVEPPRLVPAPRPRPASR